MIDYIRQINESYDYIRKQTDFVPEIAIIMGTGLGKLGNSINVSKAIDYSEIPNFPVSTVESHQGRLLLGEYQNKRVIAMQGRFHYYEGYSMNDITLPVRVMNKMGANTLILSNACGSMNTNIRNRSIMLIEDHINLLGTNPLIGLNHKELGDRFVDMSSPYSERLIRLVESIAVKFNILIYNGVYAAMSGPSLETKAEYKMLNLIGADVVGMSTVPEVIVANQLKMEVLAISIVTDECYPETLKPVNIEEIIENATATEPKLNFLITELLKRI